MRSKITQHPIQQLSSLLLFTFFVLFLLPVLIFSAGAYKTSVEAENLNNNLYTASNYITTKFRQHDRQIDGQSQISMVRIQDHPALSFVDEIGGARYRTWLYLLDGRLKELYALDSDQNLPDVSMGMTIADLSVFSFEETSDGLYWFTIEDENGVRSRFCLHTSAAEGDGRTDRTAG